MLVQKIILHSSYLCKKELLNVKLKGKKELTKCFVMLALVFYMVYFFPQESFILTTEHFTLISFCITKGVTNEYGS